MLTVAHLLSVSPRPLVLAILINPDLAVGVIIRAIGEAHQQPTLGLVPHERRAPRLLLLHVVPLVWIIPDSELPARREGVPPFGFGAPRHVKWRRQPPSKGSGVGMRGGEREGHARARGGGGAGGAPERCFLGGGSPPAAPSSTGSASSAGSAVGGSAAARARARPPPARWSAGGAAGLGAGLGGGTARRAPRPILSSAGGGATTSPSSSSASVATATAGARSL